MSCIPTPEMLLAGSMVHWSKYVSKEEAAMDVWNSMLRNAPIDRMIETGLQNYSEGGCSGLSDYERREVVRAILEAVLL
jgi:hypothetical protein